MKFTEEFKQAMLKLLEENEADCLAIDLLEEEDHSFSINLGIADSKDAVRLIELDGLKVAIAEDVEECLQEATFGVDGDELTIDLGGCACHEEEDCCCEHHHHEEEDCCCGHHHHEEEDCCCGHHHHEGECCCGDEHEEDCCNDGCCCHE